MGVLREYLEKSIKIEQLRKELLMTTVVEAIMTSRPEGHEKYIEQYQGIVEEIRHQAPEDILNSLNRMVTKGYTYKAWTKLKNYEDRLPLKPEVLEHLVKAMGEVK